MAVKKSELYSVLWEACNKLRGGVEPSRYKDYVLVLLFFKYVTDKYKGQPFGEFKVSKGYSFDDLILVKGKSDVGEKVDVIIQKFLEKNKLIGSIPDVSFNNADELGTGKELVDKVSGLISIFQNPNIDFKNNRAGGDDIMGDAYEYFMMKFAQDSGKSKGQFYTPSEVSRIIARLIGIGNIKESSTKKWTLFDPAAGSGSLLIRAADEAPLNKNGQSIVTIFGQEKIKDTAGLAKMNLVLHQKGTGEIKYGNSLAAPAFVNDYGLRQFDFIVMNPPFSDKDWSDGIKPSEDKFKRFEEFGTPPEKNGDYAWFLHVMKSLNSGGKAGIILPHGVLFRGGAEEIIRKKILKKKCIKGIISLPANLFYGTGIPACIILIDKENTQKREGIFLIDASNGFKKDGNKNRLREQDIERIVQVYNNQIEIEGYSRFVKYDEILDKSRNDGNLNIARYIQKTDDALPQNVAAHLNGGIPEKDVESLNKLWEISPNLKQKIFTCIDKKNSIYILEHRLNEIENIITQDGNMQKEKDLETNKKFQNWKSNVKDLLLNMDNKTDPKLLIRKISRKLLKEYEVAKLLDNYDVYDCLLNYWNDEFQDDAYIIKNFGYKVGRELKFEYQKKKVKGETVENKNKVKSFNGEIIPKEIVEEEYFMEELDELNNLMEKAESIRCKLTEMIEEESGDEGLYNEVLNNKGDIISKKILNLRIKEIEHRKSHKEEYEVLCQYLQKWNEKDEVEQKIKILRKELDSKVQAKYFELTIDEVKHLLFDLKWMRKIEKDITELADQVLNALSAKVVLISKRYEHSLKEIEQDTENSRKAVISALKRMGYKC